MYPREMKTYICTKICARVFKATLLMIDSQRVETIQVAINWWMDKRIVYLCDGILCSHKEEWSTDTWMNLENSKLSKEARHKMLHTAWFHLYEMSRIHKSIETESRIWLVVAKDWGVGRKWWETANWYRISFGSDESVLKLIVVMTVQLWTY